MTAATVTLGRRLPARATSSLARVESLRVLRHPAFLLGAAATALVAVQVVTAETQEYPGDAYYRAFAGWFLLWFGVLIAGAGVAGRGRLLGDPDLFSGVPAPPATRAVAAMLALGPPVALTAVAVGVAASAHAADGGFQLGAVAYSEPVVAPLVEWAQIPLVVLLAGVVGVAVVQLPRWRLGALVVVAATTFLSGPVMWAFAATPLRTFYPFMFQAREQRLPPGYSPADRAPGDPPLLLPDDYTDSFREVHLDTAAVTWHLAYLVGLILAVAWIAVRLTGERRRHRWLLAGFPLVAVAGVAQYVAAGPTP